MDLDEGPDGMEEEIFEAEEKKIVSTRSRTRSRSRSRSVPLMSEISFGGFLNVLGILLNCQLHNSTLIPVILAQIFSMNCF